MINHVRTLLLNISGNIRPGYKYPGEEYVPSEYRAVKLPDYLQLIRSSLFSRSPDRLMMNYRLAEYMELLHSTPLVERVLELDPRVTYMPANEKIFNVFRSPAVVVRTDDNAPDGFQFFFQNLANINQRTDRDTLLRRWIVWATSSYVSEFDVLDPPLTSVSEPIFDVPLTGTRILSNSDIPYKFSTDPLSSVNWQITVLHKPSKDIGEVLANIEPIVDGSSDLLFGRPPVGKYKELHDIWREHDELAYRMGALLLAVAYRTNEIWRV